MDCYLNYLNETLIQNSELSQSYSFLSFSDIKSLKSLTKDDKDTFIIVTANKGTEILIPQKEG